MCAIPPLLEGKQTLGELPENNAHDPKATSVRLPSSMKQNRTNHRALPDRKTNQSCSVATPPVFSINCRISISNVKFPSLCCDYCNPKYGISQFGVEIT